MVVVTSDDPGKSEELDSVVVVMTRFTFLVPVFLTVDILSDSGQIIISKVINIAYHNLGREHSVRHSTARPKERLDPQPPTNLEAPRIDALLLVDTPTDLTPHWCVPAGHKRAN